MLSIGWRIHVSDGVVVGTRRRTVERSHGDLAGHIDALYHLMQPRRRPPGAHYLVTIARGSLPSATSSVAQR